MIIPKEELSNFERWQVGSFDAKPAPVKPVATAVAPPAPPVAVQEAEAPPPVALPTVEDIERIHEEARLAGYQAGFAEGQASGEQTARENAEIAARHFHGLTDNLQRALLELDQTVAEQLLGLAVEISSQVVRSAVKVNPDFLLPVIREAIAMLPMHHAHIVLGLNAADIAHVRGELGEQFSQTGTQIVEDNTITPGGCQLHAGASEVDASIETRWKRVLEVIGTEPREWLIP